MLSKNDDFSFLTYTLVVEIVISNKLEKKTFK
jgi:hypothetical protein